MMATENPTNSSENEENKSKWKELFDKLFGKIKSGLSNVKCNLTDKIQKREKPNKAVKMRAKCENLRYIAEYPVG